MANLETIEQELHDMRQQFDALCKWLGMSQASPTKVRDIKDAAKKKADKMKEKLHGDQN